MATAEIRKLEKKLKALRDKPDKGNTGRSKVDVLNQLARAVLNSKPKKTEDYARQAVTLAEKINYRKGLALSYFHIGQAYDIRDDCDKAMEYYLKALKLFDELGHKEGAACVYNDIGLLYEGQGDYTGAMDYHLKSLKLAQETGNKHRLAACYCNIGIVHRDLGEYAKALKYVQESLRISKQIKDKSGEATCYINIGDCFHYRGDHTQAMVYYFKSLRLSERLDEKRWISIALQCIGRAHAHQGDYAEALKYYLKALKLDEKFGTRVGYVANIGSIADIYKKQGDYELAIEHYSRCLNISEEIGDKLHVACTHAHIADTYRQMGNIAKGLEHVLKALEISEEIGDKNAIADASIASGNLYMAMKCYSEALTYIQKGLQIAQKIGTKEIELEGYDSLSKLFEAQQSYNKALDSYKKYTGLKEDLFNAEKSKQIADMRVRYEVEKKEKEAEIYRLKNVELRREVKQRKKAEKALKEHRDQLESRVAKRTVELKKELVKRKRAEKELIKHQDQLIALNHALSLVEEKQRRRTAAYLHDNISQALSLAIFKIRSLQESGPVKSIKKELAEIKEIIAQTNQRTRSLTFEISPPILYELGLEPAVEWLAGQFQTQHGIKCHFKNDDSSKPLNDEARIFLFQSVREILTNVSKHARAQTVKVSTSRHGNAVRISVEDDGIGFNPDCLGLKMTHNEGFGLFNIKERLRHLGGKLQVNSEKGKGTSVVLIVPLKRTPGKTKRKRR
ncbi:hypothetical protein AMJ87_07605 [candidate division WOR_3 bacterium SM23_60]|uniref:histidine kinase n=1 Tax=candidate division WOR_3 bacterium SM23_60 TaxID=1703780 RepID=A0A0S8GDF2_UNCW3|nr:MAG: hypothetical protein AMJ87_07605 [candidate division WOR_3 bacterium SM23_60]